MMKNGAIVLLNIAESEAPNYFQKMKNGNGKPLHSFDFDLLSNFSPQNINFSYLFSSHISCKMCKFHFSKAFSLHILMNVKYLKIIICYIWNNFLLFYLLIDICHSHLNN
ncbi:Protein of unknown function [Gryllus bimaculatus]|nr:Protein of unknown function [Gryllus bimaculatus]